MGNACYSVSPFFDSLNKTWATPKMCTALFFDLMVMSFPRRNRNPNNNAFKYYDKEARRKETHTNTHEMKRNPHQVWLSSNRMSEMKIDCGKWSDCMKEDVNYQAVRINWCWQGWWKSLWFRSQLSSAVCVCLCVCVLASAEQNCHVECAAFYSRSIGWIGFVLINLSRSACHGNEWKSDFPN